MRREKPTSFAAMMVRQSAWLNGGRSFASLRVETVPLIGRTSPIAPQTRSFAMVPLQTLLIKEVKRPGDRTQGVACLFVQLSAVICCHSLSFADGV